MRNHCIVCGAPLHGVPLLKCGRMPKSAQFFPDASQLDADRPIDLELTQCSGCGLVQLNAGPVDYYRDVIRSGGYSTTMHALRHEQYDRFMRLCPIKGRRIIEVGCGRGEFLRIWREDGFDVDACGIEHDPALVKIAREDGLDVSQGFAEDADTRLEGGPFDGFCSFNFLEHQPDPNGMLRCIYNNLQSEAYGLITVPSLEYIVDQECYYELIRDHIAYYSRETFCFLLEKNGFRVLSCTEVNRDTWEAIVEKKRPLDASALRENAQSLQREIDELTDGLSRAGKRLAVWGASHQGLTVLSSTVLGRNTAYVVDSAPFKQGRYTIGSHIPIVPPAHIARDPVDAVLIIAPGYTDEIAGILRRDYSGIDIYALKGKHLEHHK